MKNPLKIKPEVWAKEREIGQFSFFLKRTIIFTIILFPGLFLVNFFLSYTNKSLRFVEIIGNAVSIGIATAAGEWWNLESEYRKIQKEKIKQK